MIETPRLIVRSFSPSDWQDVLEYLSDPVTYIFEPGAPLGEEQVRALCERRSRSHDFWAVALRSTLKVIGHLSFIQRGEAEPQTWELGYIFNPAYQRQGYATEGARALVKHAFDVLGVHRIVADCNPENTASWKVLEKTGFVREGYQRKNIFHRTTAQGEPLWQDTCNYAMIAADLRT